MTRRRQRSVALGFLALVWLAFAFPMFAGKVHFPADFVESAFAEHTAVRSSYGDLDDYLLLYPWHQELATALGSGHLPLWDPSRFLGAPYAADIAAGTFYPPNWLYAAGHVEEVGTLIWAASLLASLLATYWFLSLLDAHPFGAALGAVVWSLSGFMLSWAMFDAYFGSALWLPLALGGFELARRGRWRLGVPLGGLALALSVLAGHAQIALYVWLGTGLWALAATLAAAFKVRAEGGAAVARELLAGAGAAGGAFALGAGLAAVQIAGTLQYAGFIVRQQESVAKATSIRLVPSQMETMLIPDYKGSLLTGTYQPALNPGLFIETTVFAGVVTLPLALAGFWNRHRRAVLLLGVLLAFGLLASFRSPVSDLLQSAVPGIDRTRDIARYRMFISFSLAGMGALGLDAVMAGVRSAQRVAMASGLAALAGIVVMTLSRAGTHLSASFITPRGLREAAILGAAVVVLAVVSERQAWVKAGALVLLALTSVDLWAWGFGFHPFESPSNPYPVTPVIRYLASVPGPRPRYAVDGVFPFPPPIRTVMTFNASLVYGLYALNGYDAFIPARFIDLLGLVDPKAPFVAPLNLVQPIPQYAEEPPILDLLGVRTIVTTNGHPAPGVAEFQGPDLPVLGRMVLYNQPNAFPPAFVATCWAGAGDAAALTQLSGMGDAELAQEALVAPAGAQGGADLGASPACGSAPAADTTRYAAQEVTVTTPAADPGGVLVLTDDWYPGWTATVDGAPAPILRVDVALRGVRIGPGAHVIVFRYAPAWPVQGLAATLVALAAAGLIMAWPRRRGPAPAGQPVGVVVGGPMRAPTS